MRRANLVSFFFLFLFFQFFKSISIPLKTAHTIICTHIKARALIFACVFGDQVIIYSPQRKQPFLMSIISFTRVTVSGLT